MVRVGSDLLVDVVTFAAVVVVVFVLVLIVVATNAAAVVVVAVCICRVAVAFGLKVLRLQPRLWLSEMSAFCTVASVQDMDISY